MIKELTFGTLDLGFKFLAGVIRAQTFKERESFLLQLAQCNDIVIDPCDDPIDHQRRCGSAIPPANGEGHEGNDEQMAPGRVN